MMSVRLEGANSTRRSAEKGGNKMRKIDCTDD